MWRFSFKIYTIEIETYHPYLNLVRGYIAFVHQLRQNINYIFLSQSKKEKERLVYFYKYDMVLLSTTAMAQWSCVHYESSVMVTSPCEWRILKTDKKQHTNIHPFNILWQRGGGRDSPILGALYHWAVRILLTCHIYCDRKICLYGNQRGFMTLTPVVERLTIELNVCSGHDSNTQPSTC